MVQEWATWRGVAKGDQRMRLREARLRRLWIPQIEGGPSMCRNLSSTVPTTVSFLSSHSFYWYRPSLLLRQTIFLYPQLHSRTIILYLSYSLRPLPRYSPPFTLHPSSLFSIPVPSHFSSRPTTASLHPPTTLATKAMVLYKQPCHPTGI